MDVKSIEKLNDLLQLPANRTIIKQEINRLTAPGENYGSLMLTIKIQIKNDDDDGKIDEMDVVAKLPPPSEFLQRMFNIGVTFINEIEFYKTIMPTLQAYQQQYGIDKLINCYPKYYGSRLNLNQTDRVDNDAVLLMENLKCANFTTVDRTIGFDLETTKLILRNLAEIHAIPMAIKQNNPELLKTKIKPFCKEFFLFQIDNETTKNQMMLSTIQILDGDESIREFRQKIVDVLDKNTKNFNNLPKNSQQFCREPYISWIHCDLWVNNIMIKFQDNRPIDCKLVDFQIYEYGSIARDVIFFLMTSVQLSVLETNTDYFINYYHERLIEHLKLFNCKIDCFTIEQFEDEIKNCLHDLELQHCLMMLNPIYASPHEVGELENINEDQMVQEREIPIGQKQRTLFIVNYCHKKSWL